MNSLNLNITGVILAGGKSTRMGKDKAFLLFSGRPLVRIVIDRLVPLFRDLVIVTNAPFLYKEYDVKLVKDILPGRGPLGGIYTGLIHSKDMYSFITACDMPFLDAGLLRYMCSFCKGFDAVVPKIGNRYEPLFAVYSKTCLNAIKGSLENGNLAVTSVYARLRVREISVTEIKKFGKPEIMFRNINTPLDLIQQDEARPLSTA